MPETTRPETASRKVTRTPAKPVPSKPSVSWQEFCNDAGLSVIMRAGFLSVAGRRARPSTEWKTLLSAFKSWPVGTVPWEDWLKRARKEGG
ncbi:MAG: hypothetical protein KAW17_09740 [Candidatus Eisenbacteria sp.]|nr:hypothetical protein [Candidatus Eisenbacteria bacterium]